MSQTIGDQAWSSFGKKFLQNYRQVCGLFMASESEKSRRPVEMILSLRMLPGPKDASRSPLTLCTGTTTCL